MRKMSTCLVVALLGAVPLVGCGGSSSSKSSSGTTATGSQSSEVPGGKTSSGTSATHPLTPKQRVEVCKRIIQAPSTLSASAKAKLEKSCEQAGASTSAERLIIQEACVAIASRAPAGGARERALAVCRHAP
jgi:hypothetical protein